MQNRSHSYNPWFLIAFGLWLIMGGILWACSSDEKIFIFVNTHYSAVEDVLMYYATWLGEGTTITCILLSLFLFKAFRNWWYFFTALLCVGIPPLIVQYIKRTWDLPRPYKYFHKADWIHLSPNWGDTLMTNSFPSGHTTGAFAMFCFLSMLLPVRYRLWGSICFICLALMVAYSRIYLVAHFFRDVYIGSIIGTCCSLIIFTFMNKYRPQPVIDNASLINKPV